MEKDRKFSKDGSFLKKEHLFVSVVLLLSLWGASELLSHEAKLDDDCGGAWFIQDGVEYCVLDQGIIIRHPNGEIDFELH